MSFLLASANAPQDARFNAILTQNYPCWDYLEYPAKFIKSMGDDAIIFRDCQCYNEGSRLRSTGLHLSNIPKPNLLKNFIRFLAHPLSPGDWNHIDQFSMCHTLCLPAPSIFEAQFKPINTMRHCLFLLPHRYENISRFDLPRKSNWEDRGKIRKPEQRRE